ncbi:DUF2079 domain-containing protein [Spongiactinospora sp. TRM90649]|uniref:DUF2079 domain-containing protein n=1 Tax=Spongiactinospora sp. TRM90649 TaxID=3031114 RepID=UPI0023F89604|nr:DUF2079 domain-containing protein [Spongiactinospora sp. TRM90649]MDF5757278.1 DUF2079 domain-containing protein [Spongiactinospora sp. TRM90649]
MTITDGTSAPPAPGRWDRLARVLPDALSRRATAALRGHRPRVALLVTAAATVYATLGLVRLHTFRATTFDLVIFDQAVRGYSRFGAPFVPSRGVTLDRGMDYLQLGDHFSPILALLAPFYWIHDGPATLIVLQAVLLAGAIPFLWLYTRRMLGTTPAYLVAVAYALSWPVAQAANFDFHEAAFAPLLTAILIERLHARKETHAYIAMATLLLVKEDMGLMVIGFGLFLFLTGERLAGVSFGLIGGGWTILVRGVLIPMAGGDPRDFWAYGHLAPDVPGLALALVRDPLALFRLLLGEETKLDTVLLLAWPALMLCLLSPLALAALPMVMERMLSDRALWWAADFHYSAFTVVILFCAGVDGLVRLLGWMRREDKGLVLVWAAGTLVVALTLLPRFAFDQLVHPTFYQRDARASAAAKAVAKVPSGVVVETSNSIGPALSSRTTVLLLDHQPRGAPWVVADVRNGEFPFASADIPRQRVDELVAAGYRKVFEREGIVVLNR